MDLVLDRTRVELTEGIPKPPWFCPGFWTGTILRERVETCCCEHKEEPAAADVRAVLDEDFRAMADRDGEYFVYCRLEEG